MRRSVFGLHTDTSGRLFYLPQFVSSRLQDTIGKWYVSVVLNTAWDRVLVSYCGWYAESRLFPSDLLTRSSL